MAASKRFAPLPAPAHVRIQVKPFQDHAFELNAAAGCIGELMALFAAIVATSGPDTNVHRLAELGERVAKMAKCDAEAAVTEWEKESANA